MASWPRMQDTWPRCGPLYVGLRRRVEEMRRRDRVSSTLAHFPAQDYRLLCAWIGIT